MKKIKHGHLYIGGHPIHIKGFNLLAVAKDKLAEHDINADRVVLEPTALAPVYSFRDHLDIVKAELVVLGVGL